MDIRYQLFGEENLLFQKFSGKFSLGGYIGYSQFIAQKAWQYQIKKVLIDFRGILFDDIPDDFDEVMEKMVENRKKMNAGEPRNKNVSVVFWVEKPMPTVIAQLFNESMANNNYHHCLAIEKIVHLLELPDKFSNLPAIARKLENSFP